MIRTSFDEWPARLETIKVFHDRYDAQVVAPVGAKKKIEEVVPVNATYGDVAPDAHVEHQYIDGLKEKNGVMIVVSSATCSDKTCTTPTARYDLVWKAGRLERDAR